MVALHGQGVDVRTHSLTLQTREVVVDDGA